MTAEPVQLRRLRSDDELAAHAAALGVELPVAAEGDVAGVLGEPLPIFGRTAPNRLAVLPMEGWDGTADGRPTDLVTRRWRRFGESGAGLVWGGEAVAVRPDGRANPNQLLLTERTAGDIAALRRHLLAAHTDRYGTAVAQPVIGLQLTHSGRFARPDQPRPVVAYHHPLLDPRTGVAADHDPLSDAELDDLADTFIRAAALAADAGFDFVDVKACHGYLGHELLSAVDRPGAYGGDLEGRSRWLRTVVEGIARDVPGLPVGVRLSIFDVVPHRPGEGGRGEPEPWDGPYPYAFGGDGTGLGIDLDEPAALVAQLRDLGVGAICATAGSPYYCPHVQRPAWFPPSDGYTPPEDPLAGVARLLRATAALKARHPDLVVVGTGYSYLQEWLPRAAAWQVAEGCVDAVGLGRIMLSYHDLPADVLAGRALDRRRICRTFSDCTTAPRNGIVSGCWPLDPFYKERPERRAVAAAKRRAPGSSARAGDE